MMEDILHEGLDELLGPERVWCFPYKDYSRFQYNLLPLSAQQNPHRHPIGRARLREQGDSIAAVVVGSARPDALTVWQELQHLFPDQPAALVNAQWYPVPVWPPGLRYTHCFTKDLLPEDRAPGLYPLPYAAPTRVMLPVETERDIPVSFVARATLPIRSRCAEILEREGFLALLDVDVPREQFCWILNRSKIAVSVRGYAWDTLRYWEIPYHGALLLSQRLPIVIPDNFVDGESAVFFDSLEDMVDKIRLLLADENRLGLIAAAGKKLSWEKHTAVVRARYVLDKMGVLPLFGPELRT